MTNRTVGTREPGVAYDGQLIAKILLNDAKFSDDFRGNKNKLVRSSLFNIRNEIWWLSLVLEKTVSFFHFYDFHLANDGEVFVPAPGIETEGLLWFSNLSIADPYYILPCILLLSNLTNIEVSAT